MRHHRTTDTENIPPLSTKVIKVGIKVTGLYQTRNVHTQKKKLPALIKQELRTKSS